MVKRQLAIQQNVLTYLVAHEKKLDYFVIP